MIFKSNNTNLNFVNGVAFLTFPNLSELDFVKHAFSTRIGGVSDNEFNSMNLAFGRGDSDENVRKNYKLMCDAVGLDYSTLVSSAQDHHTFVRKVTSADCGIGIESPKDMLSVDGLMTNEPNVTLVTHYADCTPLLFADPEKHVIATSHAGWRGTASRMGQVTVERMTEEYGCDPEDIIAVVGPAIGGCCYEVDTPVYEKFASMIDLRPAYFTKSLGRGKHIVDLKEVNRRTLLSAGLLPENILVSDLCTKCNSDLLFSHRATNGKRGGLSAFISMTE